MTGHLGEGDLRTEISQSKERLEDRLGVEVPFFAYPYGVRPYGAYSLRSEAILREAGYQCSCTSRISRAAIGTGAWLLPRISLVGSDTALDARAKAAGAYDWVAQPKLVPRLFPRSAPPAMKTYFLFHDKWTEYIKADWAASRFPFDGFIVVEKTRAGLFAFLWRRARRLGIRKVADGCCCACITSCSWAGATAACSGTSWPK